MCKAEPLDVRDTTDCPAECVEVDEWGTCQVKYTDDSCVSDPRCVPQSARDPQHWSTRQLELGQGQCLGFDTMSNATKAELCNESSASQLWTFSNATDAMLV